jgi:voltage-gated potassium channel
MTFIHQAFAAFILITFTLLVQSAGMAALIEWLKRNFPKGLHHLGTVRSAVLVVRFTSMLICLNMMEILLWAWFYRWQCFASWESAFYFSAASYSTVGAGDLFLQPTWRTMGPIESVTGVLMCGLSAAFLFAVVNRLVALENPELADPSANRAKLNG